MAGKSEYQTDAVLNVLRGTDITAPASVYAGLFSAAPANDGAAGTELTGAGGYARQAITFGAPEADAGNVRKVANTNTITFGRATGSDWAASVAFGIFDQATEGNLLYWANLTTPKTVLVDDSLQFDPETLVVKED